MLAPTVCLLDHTHWSRK
ncbi:unnamed protein product [Linum tenue]|uniref:Uncharacterized protein n=1 Tax=Linum tenue TaxID=586396 RepID=A0AAV0JES3_9ROSI|nr:unnamed protein product [Linum tenue]